jgi:hypothetical protein
MSGKRWLTRTTSQQDKHAKVPAAGPWELVSDVSTKLQTIQSASATLALGQPSQQSTHRCDLLDLRFEREMAGIKQLDNGRQDCRGDTPRPLDRPRSAELLHRRMKNPVSESAAQVESRTGFKRWALRRRVHDRSPVEGDGPACRSSR